MTNASDDPRPAAAEARAEYLSRMGKRGKRVAIELVRERKRRGMAAAVEWRESRRCHCGALAYRNCAHRDAEGPARSKPQPASREHMPFDGHRTVAEVWQDEVRSSICRELGRG